MGLNMPGVAQRLVTWFLIFFLLLDSAMMSSFLSMMSLLVLYVPCLPLCSSEFLLATDLKCARRCYLYKLDSLEILKVIVSKNRY